MAGSSNSRTRTSTTRNIHTEPRISIISFRTTTAIRSFRVVTTTYTNTGLRFTYVSMTITFTPLTVREIPVTWLTLVTFTTVRIRSAFTLACGYVTEVIQCPNAVAVTSCNKENIKLVEVT